MDTGKSCDHCGDKGSDFLGDPVVDYNDGNAYHIGCAEELNLED
jgi:hypothetical protein